MGTMKHIPADRDIKSPEYWRCLLTRIQEVQDLRRRVKALEDLLQRWHLVHNTDYMELNRETEALLKDRLEALREMREHSENQDEEDAPPAPDPANGMHTPPPDYKGDPSQDAGPQY